MKLLFLSQYFPPETGAGATRAETLRRYLTDKGWEVDILCEMPNYPSGEIPETYRGQWYHTTQSDRGSVIRSWVIPTRRENFLQQIVTFGSFMVSSFLYGIIHPNKYDAVYATSPPIFGAVSGRLLSKLYRVPFFFEVRDLWPDAALETGYLRKNSYTYKISKWLEKWMYKKADLVIPVTHRSEQLIKKTSPDANTFVIYNGVDTRHFRPVEAPFEKIDEMLDKNVFRVGYVGTIGVIHDLETVVKAAKKLEHDDGIEFVIIGDGSRSSHLKSLLQVYQPKNVKWLGIKNHEKIPAYISTLDLGLNPVYNTRVFESIITVKFFEYLACETPVISMANGLLREVGAESKAAVTITPEDPSLLADTIRRLKNSPEERQMMKFHSRSFVLRHFDRQKWIHLLSEVLHERLEDKASRIAPVPGSSDRTFLSEQKW